MQMIDVNDLVSASFEPCPSFASGDGSPICAGCGWLDGEHSHAAGGADAPLAEIFSLPAPVRVQKRAKRLAS